MGIIILRIDKNKVLHIVSQKEMYAGENVNEMVQVLVHPSLINVEPSKCDFILHFKNSAIQNGTLPLFLSNDKKENFFIAESIFDSKMVNVSGFEEMFVEIQTPLVKFKTSPVRFSVKPSRKQKIKQNISLEFSEIEDRLIAIENRCKTYFHMAKKEADKTKKCVQIMLDLIKEQGGVNDGH